MILTALALALNTQTAQTRLIDEAQGGGKLYKVTTAQPDIKTDKNVQNMTKNLIQDVLSNITFANDSQVQKEYKEKVGKVEAEEQKHFEELLAKVDEATQKLLEKATPKQKQQAEEKAEASIQESQKFVEQLLGEQENVPEKATPQQQQAQEKAKADQKAFMTEIELFKIILADSKVKEEYESEVAKITKESQKNFEQITAKFDQLDQELEKKLQQKATPTQRQQAEKEVEDFIQEANVQLTNAMLLNTILKDPQAKEQYETGVKKIAEESEKNFKELVANIKQANEKLPKEATPEQKQQQGEATFKKIVEESQKYVKELMTKLEEANENFLKKANSYQKEQAQEKAVTYIKLMAKLYQLEKDLPENATPEKKQQAEKEADAIIEEVKALCK